jgi:hypothetical protein
LLEAPEQRSAEHARKVIAAFAPIEAGTAKGTAAAWRSVRIDAEFRDKYGAGMFRSYRLRVAEVMRDYGLHDRSGAPPDASAVHG